MSGRLFRPFGKLILPGAPVPADFESADKRLIGLLNSFGGTWAPVTPIYIAGAGLKLDAPLKFSATKTRVIRMSVLEYAKGRLANEQWEVDRVNGSVQSIANSSVLYLPLVRLHDGARLVQAKVFFQVPLGKPSLPVGAADYPSVDIYRCDPASGSMVGQGLIAAGGPNYPVQPDLQTYVNGGKPNALIYTPDQNHNPINRGTYHYLLRYIDDTVAGAPRNKVCGVELTFDLITDLRPA